jgi:hypothetical protein
MPTAAATQRLRFGSAAAVNGELGGAPVDAVRLQSERTLRVEVGPGPASDQRALQFVVERYHDEAGLPAPEQGAIDAALTAAEAKTGAARAAALTALAAEVTKDVAGAKDAARTRAMAGEIRRLAAASK